MVQPGAGLPAVGELLAVVAHPDDESFGLGGVLAAFVDQATRVGVLCFTHGEASTLGAGAGPLGERRAAELEAAAAVLGVDGVECHAYPDGQLGRVPVEELVGRISDRAGGAGVLLTFDDGGITAHPDHVAATDAALAYAAGHHLPVLGWALPETVAAQLNTELETSFVGRAPGELDFSIRVDRARQRDAIACHASQSTDNPVLWRRLDLLGDAEHLRWLVAPPPGPATSDVERGPGRG